MKPVLILIRGNSASGKTFLANRLRQYFGDDCLLIHQDFIRREVLHASDHPGTPAIGMIKMLIDYGFNKYPITIVEGILRRDVYGDMLNSEAQKFGKNALIYYLDVPFSTTVANDSQKPTSFGADVLRSWWREKDYLNQDDRILNQGTIVDFYKIIIKEVRQIRDVNE